MTSDLLVRDVRVVDGTGWAAYGADVAVTDGVPPAVNHPRGVRRLTRAAEEMLGPDSVTPTEQSLGGEDFSWMLQQVPGALARLGVRTPGRQCPDIHQPTFVVDEACIAVGLKVLAEVATTGFSGSPVTPR